MKVLIATDKPFSSSAVKQIQQAILEEGMECVMLEKYTSKEELKTAIASVEAVIIRSDIIDAEVIDAANNLKIIVRAGAGYDNVDCKAAKERGICVMNTPGQNANAVAELVLGMMVFMARCGYNGKAGKELKGKKIGIHAFGNVGIHVARIANGFGMDVYAFDPFVKKEVMDDADVICCKSVNEMYSVCDYISLHIPATSETKRSINYALLKHLPIGATLVNTARKEVINEEEILKFIEERKDFTYISDIAPDNKDEFSPFEGRYFFTPKKMGAQTEEANVNAGVAAANQIAGFLKHGEEKFRVN